MLGTEQLVLEEGCAYYLVGFRLWSLIVGILQIHQKLHRVLGPSRKERKKIQFAHDGDLFLLPRSGRMKKSLRKVSCSSMPTLWYDYCEISTTISNWVQNQAPSRCEAGCEDNPSFCKVLKNTQQKIKSKRGNWFAKENSAKRCRKQGVIDNCPVYKWKVNGCEIFFREKDECWIVCLKSTLVVK